MARARGRMKPCPCLICRCDKRVSVSRRSACDYCSADTHRSEPNGAIMFRAQEERGSDER